MSLQLPWNFLPALAATSRVFMACPLLVAGCAEGNPDAMTDTGAEIDVDAAPSGDGDQDPTGACPGGAEPAVWYFDADGDDFGDSSRAQMACAAPSGYVAESGDCDDSLPLRNPGAVEVCDGFDNDCNVGTSEVCPNNCAPLETQGRTYLFCNGVATWADARGVCVTQGMDLAQLDDQTENAWVASNAGVANGGEGGAWIRATDQAAEGTWQWADSTVFWNGDEDGAPAGGQFSMWNPGEPNDAGGNEDCAELVGEGNWNDVGCFANRGFICERGQ